MKTFRWFCLALVLGSVGTCVWTDRQLQHYKRDAEKVRGLEQRTSILQAELAVARVDAEKKDTVWRTAKARVDTLRDSVPVWQHDTTYVREYVTRAEEALQACTELADSCRVFRLTADSTIAAERRVGLAYKSMYDAVKPTWRDRLGICVGYGGTLGPDQQLLHGVNVGVCGRVWP